MLRSGEDGADRMMDRLRLITRAVSLGDTESLIMRPGSLLRGRRRKAPNARMPDGVADVMLRLSIGLEDAEDLLDDLRQALAGK